VPKPLTTGNNASYHPSKTAIFLGVSIQVIGNRASIL